VSSLQQFKLLLEVWGSSNWAKLGPAVLRSFRWPTAVLRSFAQFAQFAQFCGSGSAASKGKVPQLHKYYQGTLTDVYSSLKQDSTYESMSRAPLKCTTQFGGFQHKNGNISFDRIVQSENSSDLDVGRRPKLKSDEFSD
jgi:hypothetical protein